MNDFQIKCDSETRKKLLKEEDERINGIDYIEVRRIKNPNIQNNNSDSNTDRGSNISSPETQNNDTAAAVTYFYYYFYLGNQYQKQYRKKI